jgi:hypothetical protein
MNEIGNTTTEIPERGRHVNIMIAKLHERQRRHLVKPPLPNTVEKKIDGSFKNMYDE